MRWISATAPRACVPFRKMRPDSHVYLSCRDRGAANPGSSKQVGCLGALPSPAAENCVPRCQVGQEKPSVELRDREKIGPADPVRADVRGSCELQFPPARRCPRPEIYSGSVRSRSHKGRMSWRIAIRARRRFSRPCLADSRHCFASSVLRDRWRGATAIPGTRRQHYVSVAGMASSMAFSRWRRASLRPKRRSDSPSIHETPGVIRGEFPREDPLMRRPARSELRRRAPGAFRSRRAPTRMRPTRGRPESMADR